MIIPGIFEQTTQKAVSNMGLVGNEAEKIQLDVADGNLVDGRTFSDLSFLSNIEIKAQIQLHLMVQKPESYLMFLPTNIKEVCVQAEAFMYKPLCMEAFDDVLRAKNIRAGLSFNFSTPFEDFIDCIRRCDFVQFMTVRPGAQGRPFIMPSLDKIVSFKAKYPHIHLQVDGGISLDTLKLVIDAGADDMIVDSAIFKSEDPVQTYKDFVLQSENAHRDFYHSKNRNRFAKEKSF